MAQWFIERRDTNYVVRHHITAHLAEGFTPDPDIALHRYRKGRRRRDSGPTAEDVILVIEFCEEPEGDHAQLKTRMYAQAGIPELWVVDVHGRTVNRLSRPGPEGYEEGEAVREPEQLTPVLAPTVRILVRELLPRVQEGLG